jgi:mRNA-degrading endonuclease toxin of MazEF toxin-antitoxin module
MKRGELYLLKSDPSGKPRPILVVSKDVLNKRAVLGIPFYSQQIEKRSAQDWCSLFYSGEGNLEKDCVANASEITLIDKFEINQSRGPIGQFDDAQMERVLEAVRWVLGIA